ncbi:MAG: DUF4956 domain-containing protein [Anaerolineae bacterium]|nr:DUF4956 domain-containing protein [Anaerolineae bacterium]
MNDILNKIELLVKDPAVQVDMTGFIFALVVSAIIAVVIAALYQLFYEDRATGSQIHRSFLLMSPAITGLFIAIQFSLPLSLGLLGALSIIRFRTPVKEPEEVSFLMLLIACAVICATFQFVLLFSLLSLALVLLLLQKALPRLLYYSKRKDGILLITISDREVTSDKKAGLLRVLETRLPKGKIESISYAENLTTIHYSFTGLKAAGIDGLQPSLNEIVPIQKLNVFFNGQGTLL